jgi:diguanylate cyclase (GGDEF)-like protein
LAERIRQRLVSAPFSTLDGDVTVTASIGVSAYDGGPGVPDADALLRAADAALYRAKDLGRNRVEVASGPRDPRTSAA